MHIETRQAQRIAPVEQHDITVDVTVDAPPGGASLEVQPACGASLSAFVGLLGCVLATPFLLHHFERSHSLPWPAAAEMPSGPVRILPGWQWHTAGAQVQVRGWVHNGGAVPVTAWAVTVEFRDAAGRVVEAQVMPGRGAIAPGADAEYALSRRPFAGFVHPRVFVSSWALARTR